MKQDSSWQDHTIRVCILACGIVAAILFVLKGTPEVLPALAVGGTLGACLVRRAGELD